MAYLAYGVAFSSDLPLALPTVGRTAELLVTHRPEAVARSTVDRLGPGPDGWGQVGMLGPAHYLLFADEAEFVVSADGSTIQWHCFGDRSETLTHLLLDHVLPRALTRRGRVVLHGSAVSSGNGSCLAIIGDSGQGKSTLAAALVSRGHRFLADDCVVVDLSEGVPLAAPAYPELRLSRESVGLAEADLLTEVGDVTRRGHKKRMALAGSNIQETGPRQLSTVFVLDPSETANPAPTRGAVGLPFGPARATIELLGHSFQLNDADERSAVLERFATVAQACEIRPLRYGHSEEGLRAAVTGIEDTMAASGRSV